MAWTAPQTWSSQLVTVDEFNEQIRDNMLALKDPPTDLYNVDEGADYTTTSTSFVDVDSAGDPDLELSITTGGGDVLVWFFGTFAHGSSSGRVFLDVTLDGTRQGDNDGLIAGIVPATASGSLPIGFSFLIQNVTAGTHTFKLQWKTATGTLTLHAGAGTSNGDLHPQFGAREVS